MFGPERWVTWSHCYISNCSDLRELVSDREWKGGGNWHPSLGRSIDLGMIQGYYAYGYHLYEKRFSEGQPVCPTRATLNNFKVAFSTFRH